MKKYNLNFLKKILIDNRELLLFLLLSIFLYLIFYRNIFNSQFNFWNSDAAVKMFPVRVFLYEKLSNYELPLWTERVFLGYPIYLDIENGILNPINLFFIFIFGPVLSLKLMHLITFLVGALSIFYLFSKIYPNSHISGKLAGVLVFYFSFFQINHLIHMNMVLVAMLLPIHIYLCEKYVSSKRNLFLILQILVLSYGVLWGQPQITFFNLCLTILFFYFQTKDFFSSAKYFLTIFLCSILLTMFQLYPSYSTFLNSSRSELGFKYWEFSNSPTIFLNNVFPFALGYYQNYQGSEISGAMSIVETYGYLGVSILTIFIFYLIFGTKDKNFNFVFFGIIFYLVFTFVGLFFDIKIPLYNDFRYWTRGVFFLSFLLIFPVNFFLSQKFERNKPQFKYLSLIGVIFLVGYFFENKDFINYIIQNNFIYLKKIDIFIWITLLLLSTIIFYFYYQNRISVKVFGLILFTIFLFDLRYFASDLLPFRISRFKSELSFKTPSGCEYKRCLLENQNYNGYEFLIFKTFSPFGYTHFIDKEYTDFFEKNFHSDLDQSPRSEIVRENLDKKFLEELGIQKIVLANGIQFSFPENKNWLVKDNKSNNFKYIKEGNYSFEYLSDSQNEIKLNLKYTQNFRVWVNNQETFLIKDGVFSKIFVNEGKNLIEIKFFPFDVLKGLIIGIVGLMIFFLSVKLLNLKIINK